MTKREKLQALSIAAHVDEAATTHHAEIGEGDTYRSFGCATTMKAARSLRAAMRREPESYPTLAAWISS